MSRFPLAPVIGSDGATLGWVTAAADGTPDVLLAGVLQSAAKRETAEECRRAAIRSGELPAERWTTWNISDRD